LGRSCRSTGVQEYRSTGVAGVAGVAGVQEYRSCRSVGVLECCQSGEQCSIGFQPVSSVDGGWLPFLSGMTISAWLEEKNRSRLVVRYRLEAYATLRRCHVRGGARNRLLIKGHFSQHLEGLIEISCRLGKAKKLYSFHAIFRCFRLILKNLNCFGDVFRERHGARIVRLLRSS
jgi:hypothetical protein